MDIRTSGLCVGVPRRRIVDGATIHVDEGELVGLLGPNGSGKSTMLKSIYRTMDRECGDILIDGRDIDDLSLRDSARMLSVVTQHNYYNFDFKVEDVVLMGRTPHKRAMEMDSDEDFRIVDEALAKVNMLDFKDRTFSSLSGGEQQRIILARALAQQTPCLIPVSYTHLTLPTTSRRQRQMCIRDSVLSGGEQAKVRLCKLMNRETNVLLLDEPTNHLDIKYQLEVLDIVKSLGCTALCALHDLNLAAEYCDRIYILHDGRIVMEGTPEEVITEGMIREIYGVRASVERNPHTGMLNVVYYPAHSGRTAARRGSWLFLDQQTMV